MDFTAEHISGAVIAAVAIAAFVRSGRNNIVSKDACDKEHKGVQKQFDDLKAHLDTRFDDLRVLILGKPGG